MDTPNAGNELRAEIRATVEGQDYLLRPTFQALLSIEGRIGQSLLDVIRRGAIGKPWLRDIQVVLEETSAAGGKAIPAEVLGRFILAQTEAAAKLMGQVLEGAFPPAVEGRGPTSGKEAPPAQPH